MGIMKADGPAAVQPLGGGAGAAGAGGSGAVKSEAAKRVPEGGIGESSPLGKKLRGAGSVINIL